MSTATAARYTRSGSIAVGLLSIVSAAGCGSPCRCRAAAHGAPATPVSTVAEPSPANPGPPVPAGAAEASEPAAEPAPSSQALQAPASSPAAQLAEPPPAAEKPLPDVTLQNIGLHVGGGPNDAATKAPFRQAIEAHFDAIARCYAQVESAGKSGSFGVDITIPAAGGKASVSAPRTALGPESFRGCVVDELAQVSFAPPRRGATTISYSLLFTAQAQP